MWTSTKLLGDWPVKELCPQVALSSDSSVAFIHQERAIFALSIGTRPSSRPQRTKTAKRTKTSRNSSSRLTLLACGGRRR
jgi:hypothetical protein